MKIKFMLITASLMLGSISANAGELPAGDPINGHKISKKCAMCHTVNEGGRNKTGPNLFGIVGRGIAEADKFHYSPAFLAEKEKKAIWDKDSLNAFLTKPKAFIKKTRMSFPGIKKEQDRADLISYLETLKAGEKSE